MELKPGHKQTEVGAIPEDWEVVTLGDLNPFVTSGSRGWAAFYADYGDLFVRITNMSRKSIYLDLSASRFIRIPADASEGVRTQLQEHDVLISITADIGIVGYVDAAVPLPAYINQHIALVRFNPAQVSGKFVSYFLAADSAQRHFRAQTDNGAKAGMNLGGVAKIQTALPSLPEQSAIATALSDADVLLSALDALIAKQRAIKQGAMQELLTGKRRLPGFCGEWEVKRLGDHLKFLRNGTHSRAELTDEGSVKYLHYGDIHSCSDAVWDASHRDMPYLPLGKATNLARLESGDLVFADASEDLIGVAKSVEIAGIADEQAVPGLHTIAVRFDKSILADGFKAYLQFIPAFRNHLLRLVAGTKVYSTNRAHISGCELALPSTEEQIAIAQVLGDMDAVIAELEAKRGKVALLKQGMMQELLTGRTRLVAPAATHANSTNNVVEFPAQKKASTAPLKSEKKPGGRQAPVAFKRSVLAAEIVDQLHNEPTFGHVKFEKLIFLAEHICKVDTGSNYHRDAAGPYDNRALRSIDSQLKTQKWFEAQKQGSRYQYVPLEKHGGHKEYFDRYYANIRPRLDEIIAIFRTAKTEQCEIVATLYGAWNDLLRQSKPANDDAIVDEVLNHWHEDKKRITAERWRKALSWMREKGFAPEGTPKA